MGATSTGDKPIGQACGGRFFPIEVSVQIDHRRALDARRRGPQMVLKGRRFPVLRPVNRLVRLGAESQPRAAKRISRPFNPQPFDPVAHS